MLRHTTVAPARAWYTWSSRPAEMVFLPLGVRLTPVGFAGSTGKATLFPSGPGVRFGRHAVDASRTELTLTHAGTTLEWAYDKADPFTVAGSWTAPTLGEWGLRFWVNLCLSAEGGETVRFDAANGAAVVKVGHRFVALASREAPALVTGHATVEGVVADYEAHGYFYLGARAEAAPVLALRFNLEQMRDNRFAVAVADREDRAIERAKALAAAPAVAAPPPAHAGRFAGALDAIRDVMAWNTVWDEVNGRPYTSISRNWNLSKFGGFGVWLDDQQYNGLLTGLLDEGLAGDNVAAWLASATPEGNLACLITANDAWVDRTQIPVGAFVAWLAYARSGSRAGLEAVYDTLSRNHAWWWANRDPEGLGLVSYGTSDVGEGLYQGTHFGARNESSMDNSPIHDEAVYEAASRTLTTIDVGLNSLLALDAEMLARIARVLGRDDAAAAFDATAEGTRAKIRDTLWDDERGLFANRLRGGGFVRSVGPTSFYPLAAGAASEAQAERLLAHLTNPETFGGPHAIPGTARSDPAAKDNSYWRGRIWPPLNFFTWQGLHRYGRTEEAAWLAAASYALFDAAWGERRLCPENYNAETGEPLDQPDTEGFYSWGALMPLMAVGEIMDVSPWSGWTLANGGAPVRLGPLRSPAGMVTVAVEDGVMTLARGSRTLLRTALRGRFTRLRFDAAEIRVTLPQDVEDGGRIAFGGVEAGDVVGAWLGGEPAAFETEADGIAITVTAAGGKTLRVVLKAE